MRPKQAHTASTRRKYASASESLQRTPRMNFLPTCVLGTSSFIHEGGRARVRTCRRRRRPSPATGTRTPAVPMGGGAASLSSFDARLAKAPYLRNASYWRGQGRAWEAAAHAASGAYSFGAAAATAPPCPGAFATQLSGEKYVPLALCLQRQLQRHRSRCPLLVIFDDVTPGRNLSATSLRRLGSALGGDSRLVPLSSLVARAFADPRVAWPPSEEAGGNSSAGLTAATTGCELRGGGTRSVAAPAPVLSSETAASTINNELSASFVVE